jgi:hypothetical protein
MQQPRSLVSDLLARCNARVLPLTQSADRDEEGIAELCRFSAGQLLPNARNAEVGYSALLLLLGDWKGSHDLTDDDESPEGCYLHAIIHRIEPDSANSSYWFRHMGEHPLFPAVQSRAQEILRENPVSGWQLKSSWDPFLFNKWCEEARTKPRSDEEKTALAVQRAEWNLLFEWCSEQEIADGSPNRSHPLH